MRITVAGSAFVTQGGGIKTYNRLLVGKLVQRGHVVQIVTPETGDGLPETYPSCNVMASPLPPSAREEPEWARAFFNAIVAFDPDVIINSDHSTVASLFPSFARRRVCISVSHFYNGVVAKTAAIYPNATDWIIAISRAGRDYLSRYIAGPFNGLVVQYVSSDDLPDAEGIVDRKSWSRPIKVCFPGGSNRNKRPDVFGKIVRHFADCRDVAFEWIGEPRGYRRRLKGIPAVHFSGQVPTMEEAQRLIAASHVFVLPSRGEGCPSTLLEAMRSGAVPLVSDCPSAMREIVVDGENGFVIRGGNRPAGYIVALKRLLADPTLGRTMARNARRTFLEKLNPRDWIESMERLFVRRPGCVRGDRDEFRRRYLLRWQRRTGRWYRPTLSYFRTWLGLLDRRPL